MCSKVRRSTLMISSVSLVAVVVLAVAGPAWAVVPSYTPSYRGDPNSVHAIFDWGSDAWNVTLFESVSGGYPLDQTSASASDDGMDVTVILPNFIDPLPMKLMRIQLFFDGPVDSDLLEGEITAYDPTGAVVVNDAGDLGSVTASVLYFDFELFPNPDWEQAVLYGNENANILPGNLLRMEFDTVSIIPEPATLGVLLAGGLAAMLRWRRP